MKKQQKLKRQQAKFVLEELEERRLFSGGIEGLISTDLDPEPPAIYADANGNDARATDSDLTTSAAAAEQQSREIVFVDAGVDNYQQLVDDLNDNSDASRNIEVVLLDSNRDGLLQIATVLEGRDDLDAIHIISHGSDGSVQLGNTNLNAETLQDNNLKVALWANAFAEHGDILIYGCNLAQSEAGQSLIDDLGSLTLTDVAASTDTTGHQSLGGDWDLEHQVGDIEASVAPSADMQARYEHILAVINGTAGDDVLAGTAGDDVISGDSGNDVLVGGGGNDQLLGEANDDVFRFTGAKDGDVYTVDGGSDNDTIDLSEFGSGTVTDDGSTITVDLGDGESFTINYSNVENVVTADTAGNHGPDANAGPDQPHVMENVGVDLDGTRSDDFDGDALTYQWNQIGGPAVTLSDPNAAQPSFTSPNVATSTTLTFQLVVSDGTTSHVDTIEVTVLPTITGGFGGDNLTGTAGDDFILGLLGADTLDGGDGDDVLAGGMGNDVLIGGSGTDIANYSDSFGGVTVDITLAGAQNTGGGGTDTLSGIEGVIGSTSSDTFAFSNPQDGAVYSVDGNTGTNTLDLSGYASTDVTFGDGLLTLDMGGGQSFSIEYTRLNLIAFSDITATVLTGDASQAGFSGSGLWIDGAEAFRIDVTGGGTVDLAYDTGSDTLSVTGTSGTSVSTALVIEDLNGTDLRIDQIAVNTDLGSLTSDADIGAIDISDGDFTISTITVDGGAGRIGSFSTTATIISPTTINADIDSVTLLDVDATIDFNGDVSSIDVGKVKFDMHVTGSLGSWTTTDDLSATLQVDGDLGSLSSSAGLTATGSIIVGGDLGGTVLGDVNGAFTVAGDLTSLSVGKINAGPEITVGGDVGAITTTGTVSRDITIGGDLDSASFVSVAPAATITANQAVGTLVFDVGGTDHGGTFVSAVEFSYDGSTGAAAVDGAQYIPNGLTMLGFSGTGTFTDGDQTFRLDVTGAGTLDFTYDEVADKLTITGVTATDGTTSITITDLDGNDLALDAVIGTDVGSLVSNVNLGTLSLSSNESIFDVTIAGGSGTIDTVNYAGAQSDLTIFNANVNNLTVNGRLEADLTINGDVGNVTVEKIIGGQTLSVSGDVGTATFTSHSDVGVLSVGGTLTALVADANLDAVVDVDGNVGSITVAGQVSSTAAVTIDGNAGTLSITGDSQADITIGGDLDNAAFGDVTAGTITAQAVIGALVFDVGGTDHGGTYADPTVYIFNGDTQTASAALVSSAQTLWMTTEEDVASPSGANGLDSWSGGSILSFEDPNLAFGAGSTDGTLNNALNLDLFVQDGDSRLDAVHYVGTSMTVGSNAVALQAGDILLSSVFPETLVNSDTSTLAVTSRDVFVFRPDDTSNYALGGTFIKLINGQDLGLEIEGITLVEQTTTVGVGGGATTLDPGDFLFTDRNNDSVIYRLQPGVLGDSAFNTGTVTTLVDGTDFGINQTIHGVELVESNVTIGDRILTSGQLLISLYADDVVAGTSVSASDIFILNVTDTGPATTATAEIFFAGGDIGFDSWQESPWAVSLVPSTSNSAPVTADDTYAIPQNTTLTVDWWNTDWTARQQLTFNNLSQTENLADFPVLIRLNASNIDYARTQNSGEDLRFVDADGSLLAYEIESWDETGDSFVWVKVPQIDGSSDADHIMMYYGNVAASDGQSPTSVWTNGYASVWHLDSDPSLGAGAIDDSSENPLDGTASNMDASNLVDGKIGGALSFDGSSEYIRVASDATDELAITGTQMTMEAWVKRDGATGQWMVMVNRQYGNTNLDAYVSAVKFNDPSVFILNTEGGYVESSTGAVPDASWEYLTAVQDGTDMRLYVNGVEVGSMTGAGPITTDDNDVIIGGAENDGTSTITEFFRGLMDEVRISDVARSADWIAAQYASMEGTFVTYGGEQTAPATSGVTLNDSDADGDLLTAILVTGPANAASFTFNPDGTFTYTPNPGFSGDDTFTYKLNDGDSDSNIATVTISVNTAPTAANNTITMNEDAIHVFSAADFNFSDSDAGDTLQQVKITSLPANGTLELSGASVSLNQAISVADIDAGNLVFSPAADDNGVAYASFDFWVSDGHSVGTAGTVLHSFAAPAVNSMSGVAHDGTNIWLAGQNANTIYQLDTDGNVLNSFAAPGTSPTGIAFDGTNLWIISRDDDMVYEVDTSGNVLSSFATPGTDSRGLTWDGNNLWLVEGNSSLIYELTTTGSVVSNFAWPSDYMRDITWDGSSLWVSDQNDQVIRQLNTSGTELSNFASPGIGAAGLAFDGTEFWHADADTDLIYQIASPASLAYSASAYTMSIDVDAVNDAPIITGDSSGSLQEDVAVVADMISTSGTLNIVDADAGESSFQAAIITGSYGDLTIDAAGNWSYAADNTQAAIQQLDVGESLTDTLTVQAADGANHDVVITINGNEDTPVIGGTATGTVAEDGTLTASDTLTITDTDTSDNPISFNDVAATLGDNGYGNFEITANTWTYTLNNGHAAVQALDAGESLNDTFTFTASDGSTQTVTITINGNEDAPVIGGVATGTVAEDGTLTASDTLTITDTDTSDNPISFNDVAATLGDNGYGDFEITANTWTYTLNNGHAAVQALDAGESLNDTFTFTASDGSTQTVTITINGNEDAPVIGGVATGTVAEDGTLTASDTLTITDTDTSDNPISFNDVAATLGDNGYGEFEITANTWTYTLNNGHAAVQALDAGETLNDTFTFTASDGSTQVVTITINGNEDAPVIGGTATGAVAEDGTLTASDTLTITDTDTSDNPVSFNDLAATLGDNGYGNFEITSNTWTYTLNNGHAAVQALDAGESLNDTFTFTASDGSTQTVTVTINGAEDAPVIGGTATGTVAEDGTLSASNTLTITDTDTSDNPISFNDVAPTLGDNGYGNFEITANTWTYTLNNGHAAVQALDAGESLNDTFTFTASDGSTQVVTITINGNEDAPVIGGTATGTVAEDGTLTASDTLTITDTDTSDNPVSFNDVAATLGDNGYGDFEITANTWTYTLNNGHAAVQALDAGESLNDTFTFTASDGSTRIVTITINGNEDAPVIGGVVTGTVAEDGTLTASDTLTITDTDTSDNPVSFNDVAATLGDNGYGDFEITANTWTYTLNNGHAAVQALDAGESLNDTYTFTASDGSTQVVTVTINGNEDAPVIGGTTTGTVAEDGTLTATDTLTITDTDTSDNPVSFNDVAPTLGDNGYGDFEITANTWTYTLNNGHVAVQALDAGEILNDTYTFTASDGSTQVVTVTINGNEDAPVIGGTATGTVAEDGTLTATDTLTITDTDTSDNPISFNDVAATLGDNGYGNFQITANTWTYTLNNGHAAVQALDAGETLNDTFTFTASDGSTQAVTVTINGNEDAPVIGGTATGTVAEDGTLTASDTLTITDTDTSDNPISFNDLAPTLGDNGYGDFEITANTWTYTLNNGHAAVQALDAGETLNDTFTFTASDGSTQVVTITINGNEDAPIIGGVATGTVAEDGTLTATDTLTITDTDTSDNPVSFNDVAATLGDNGYGDFEITANTWTYTLNNGHAAVQALDAGETLNDTFTFTASDGSTQVVTVTINGNEDAPVIGGTATGTAAEDGTLTASDTLTITDTDTSDNPVSFNDVAATLGDNGYGDFEITANTWTYTLNNGHAAVQALDAGESLNDTFTFTASDGSTQTVTITINGNEDAPVIGGVATGTVAEDGTLTASDTLTITDTDTSDNPISFNDVAATLGDNGYGEFEITANTWTYTLNNGHAAVQALDAGETLNDTFTFTASDGSTQVVTITINGNEDAPVIGGTATGAVAEDGTLTASDTLTITDTDTSDNPVSFNDVAATLGDNGYGDFEITSNTWTYTLNNGHAAVQALDAGETLNDTFTFTASDGSTQVVTITINGNEDAPVIGGVVTGTVAEDGTLTASDTLTITDTDTSDNPVSFNDVAATLGDNGYGNFEITTNTWTYTLSNGHAAVQALDAGESLNDTFTFTASDGSTQVVTITINGNEDAPVIGGVATGTVAEDGTLTATDTLTITDTDTSDNPISFNDVAATLGDNGYGDFEITANTWTYTLSNGHAAVQALDAGESLNDTFTFTASDGSTQVVTITINGNEDAPVIGGTATGTVAEDGTLTASDTLTITDTDTSDNPVSFNDVAATLGDNGYGDFEITANTWTYTLNNGHAAVQALDAGESLNDTFTFTASDGSTQVVTVTINGNEDTPVIGGVATGTVAEDGTLTATDTLTITDTDTSDNPVSFNDVAATLGDNGYGDFEITANTWTYTLNNGHAAVQALDAGESLNDTFTFTASDGSTQVVTVTINGNEDAPVIGGVVTGTVAENGTLTASDTLTITDTDTSDNPVSFNDVAATLGDNGYGDFEITGNTWTYTLNNGHAAVQALDAGELLNDTFTFTASDGSTQVVTVTINGNEDAAVIGGTAAGTVAEDGTLTASDTLTITDADTSDNPVSFNDVAPTLGDNGYGDFEIAANTWTYTLNNGHAAVQALDAGESLNDTFTFTASDGSTQVVTVTINGNDDAPVIGGVVTGTVAEDGTLTASNTLTITDTDTSDNPISFNDVAPTLGDNGYGDFEITGNTWTYTLNNGHAAVQALDVGESLTDSFTLTTSNGSTLLVTVTIDGAEDAPTLENAIADQTATESEAFHLTLAANTFGDLDTSDTLTYGATLPDDSPLPSWLNFDSDSRTFSGTPGSDDIGVIDIKVSADDGSNVVADTFSLTIDPADREPTFGGTDRAALTAGLNVVDGQIRAAGTLTVADPDIGESSFVASTVSGALGSLTIDTAGNWNYSVSNGVPEIQALNEGESITDELAVTSADGSTHEVVILINGPQEAEPPVVAEPPTVEPPTEDEPPVVVEAPPVEPPTEDEPTVANEPPVTEPPAADEPPAAIVPSTAVPLTGIAPTAEFEPPTVEATIESERTSVAEERADNAGDSDGEAPLLERVQRLPQSIVPPQIQQGSGDSRDLQENVAATEQAASLSDVARREPSQAETPKQEQISEQDLNPDKLTLQLSDDEALNEQFEQQLLDRIDRMHGDIDNEAASQSADDVDVQIVMGSTASITVGIVSWVLRGGSLLASLMSTVPLLNRFDPLPIFRSREDEKDVDPANEDGESEGQEDEHARRVDKLFSGKSERQQGSGFVDE